ncbi:hypothetical protein Tco_1261460 [Tanacetum coccineum]
MEKSQEDEPEKTNTGSEVQSMVTVPIHQDTYFVPLITTSVIDLTVSQPVSIMVQAPLPTLTTTVTAITTTTSLLPPPTQPQQGSLDSILIQCISELEQHMTDLLQDNLALEERLDKHGSRLYKLENLDIPHQVSKAVDEIVTDAVDWAIQAPLKDRFRDLPEADMKEILHHCITKKEEKETRVTKNTTWVSTSSVTPPPPPVGPSGTLEASGAFGSSQLPPPPPPSSTNQSDQSKGTAAPSSSKTTTSIEYIAWMTTNTRLKPFVSSIPKDIHMDADSAPDEQVHLFDNEDIGNDHIPKVNLKQDWWKPLYEENRPATPKPAWSIPLSDLPIPMNNWASALASTYAPPPENSLLAQTIDMAIFMDWFCKKQGITELTQKVLEGPVFEIIKVFHPNVIHLQYQIKECHKLLTDQVDDAIIGHNVSKPLPLGGQPGQVTILADFFFNKDLEYLRYSSKGGKPVLSISKMKVACYPNVGLEQMVPDQMWIKEECKYDIAAIVVRTHMRILSVVRIEVFSLYGYDYMKTTVLRRADLNEYIIAERDFKYLYPSDFKDMYLLNLQGHLNHLPPQDKKILSIAVNLWIKNLVIRQRVEDFQLGIESYQTQLNLTKLR